MLIQIPHHRDHNSYPVKQVIASASSYSINLRGCIHTSQGHTDIAISMYCIVFNTHMIRQCTFHNILLTQHL